MDDEILADVGWMDGWMDARMDDERLIDGLKNRGRQL
jgi:hypothetical protein